MKKEKKEQVEQISDKLRKGLQEDIDLALDGLSERGYTLHLVEGCTIEEGKFLVRPDTADARVSMEYEKVINDAYELINNFRRKYGLKDKYGFD